jgi:hypothetical protein
LSFDLRDIDSVYLPNEFTGIRITLRKEVSSLKPCPKEIDKIDDRVEIKKWLNCQEPQKVWI